MTKEICIYTQDLQCALFEEVAPELMVVNADGYLVVLANLMNWEPSARVVDQDDEWPSDFVKDPSNSVPITTKQTTRSSATKRLNGAVLSDR